MTGFNSAAKVLLLLSTYSAFVLPATRCLAEAKSLPSQRYAIAIHGGAGGWPNRSVEATQAIEQGLREALLAGRTVLAGGGSSLDAVEQAIRKLEDCPIFNAGKGAVFNAEGKHQLDASIMDGRDRQAGGVAAIGVAKNPITVARLVMEKTPHVLLAGVGANAFAREQQASIVEPDYFWTDSTRHEWQANQHSQREVLPPHHYGTVGCVALDKQGNLAAGTSTGGLSKKRVGRVGDSPLVAAGTFADNETCAVSCTGVGELFIRNVIAYDIAARMRYANQTLQAAVSHHIDDQLAPGTGGVIGLNREGEVVLEFNTRAMPRGIATSEGRMEVMIDQE